MKILSVTLGLLLALFALPARAMDDRDHGTFLVLNPKYEPSATVFRLYQQGGEWRLEDRQPDGSWVPVSCDGDCRLVVSSPSDLARFFDKADLTRMDADCIHNKAFAICAFTPKNDPTYRGYAFVALTEPQPIRLRLARVRQDAEATTAGPDAGRVREVVAEVVGVQSRQGEAAAIESIQACYRAVTAGKRSVMLQECLAMDIAYANLSEGMYRHALKGVERPAYTTMAALETRVYQEAMRAGHTRTSAERLLRAIAPVALQALGPAVAAQRR